VERFRPDRHHVLGALVVVWRAGHRRLL
jgi:hypothetical protein